MPTDAEPEPPSSTIDSFGREPEEQLDVDAEQIAAIVIAATGGDGGAGGAVAAGPGGGALADGGAARMSRRGEETVRA